MSEIVWDSAQNKLRASMAFTMDVVVVLFLNRFFKHKLLNMHFGHTSSTNLLTNLFTWCKVEASKQLAKLRGGKIFQTFNSILLASDLFASL